QRCRSASIERNATRVIENVIDEVSARIKQKRAFERVELSRLKSAVIRAQAKTKSIVDAVTRAKAETTLNRLKRTLQKATPKRGASAVAFDEAAKLVSKIVTSREQAQKLIEALRRLCH